MQLAVSVGLGPQNYIGTSPLGHLYSRDTSIQGIQNLVL